MTFRRESDLNIVSIGGGTGLSTLLSGLKARVRPAHPAAPQGEQGSIDTLTAVVTVTDDGGSSGRLREEFQILPPGDIRNCMVALAEDEHLLTRLFQYRFESEGDLSGHSFGNIFLAALTGVTDDFLEAIKLTSEVLAIKGRIFPATMKDASLVAELEDGRIINGETRIVRARSRIKKLWLSDPDCSPLPETLEAIANADIITVGPGSLYTSIVPNLLVSGIVEAIKSSRAVKFCIANIMTQPGETDGFSVEDHLRVIGEYSPGLVFDYVVVNNAPISPLLKDKYLSEGAIQVELADPHGFRTGSAGPKVIAANLLNDGGLVRHDSLKLANLLIDAYCSSLGVAEDQTDVGSGCVATIADAGGNGTQPRRG
ncbi:MAG TPA: gluconeogenesis factor YvcK family protein [Blastocatellia bacterium]|nr:gluconeogenesis factor YvcK family protein [Blastocatellia bacterium]